MNNSVFDLLEHTSRSIFLTGKAGTGKTTFLNDFVKKTRKKFVVLAPTGIAAINAGGTTIHSMFGLPLRTFLPTYDRVDENIANNISDLTGHFKYRRDKLKLLREVEIIIIDEVSMLRADVLDMIDFSLRHIRRNTQPFGGVQMLFIGDLYQLPPVVRDEHVLSSFYESPFFFNAKALENHNLITIELNKVYRQTDESFLNILNAIRDGNRSEIDFEALNKRYIPGFEPKDEAYVYLCSHNRMADEINRKRIDELPGKLYKYRAKIFGDFKENQYPNEEVLELKVGAQVMFIRNDSTDKKYFNGKLAQITSLDEDEIWVRPEGGGEDFKLKKESWEQKKYTLGPDKSIQEEVLGSYEQFPIRLAWAVTIHKSQGLTFDRLIIDAGKSFASGQVYVALSRCRTLEGIVLKSEITPEVIFSDGRISTFQGETNANGRVEEILQAEKYDYSIRRVLRRTDCRWMRQALQNWHISSLDARAVDKESVRSLYGGLKAIAENLAEVFSKFEKVLLKLAAAHQAGDAGWKDVEIKAAGAVNFFFINVNEKILSPLKSFYAETKAAKGLKQYNEDFKALLDDVEDYLKDLRDAKLLDQYLFDTKNNVDFSAKVVKIPTHIVTYKMFQEGKSIPQIAKERGIMDATVIGHFSKFAEQGVLGEKEIARILPKEKIEIFQKEYAKGPEETLNAWKTRLPADFDYGEIRLLDTWLKHRK